MYDAKTLRHTLPVIDLPRGNYSSNLWMVYSPKLKRDLKLYTDIKYHHWITIESNPKVLAFCETPIIIEDVINGVRFTFNVDMWVLWSDGREEYREIMFRNNIDQKQLNLHRDMCVKLGVSHCAVTANDIYANNLYINNWKIILNLLSNIKNRQFHNLEAAITELYFRNNKFTLYSLTNVLSSKYSKQDIITAICRLLHQGKLSAPLEITPFDLSLEISCGE